jgi:hypothetical protein
MPDKTTEKKAADDPRIQHAFVMKGGKKVPIKLRHVSAEDIERRLSAQQAEEDAAALIAEHQKEAAKGK